MSITLVRALLMAMAFICPAVAAQAVIEDGGVALTRQEVEYIAKFWNPQMQKAAAVDVGDRIELLNMALETKKIAMQADKVDPDVNPEAYMKLELGIRNKQLDFVLNYFLITLEIPDMAPLADEQYRTQKDKYALVPEQRFSSHILIKCLPGQCNRSETLPAAEKVLAELQAGANFEELAAEKSEDPGSRNNGGKFDKWLKKGEPHVSPQYLGGLYAIDKVGGYSGVVESEFGFHIIRLDDIEEAHYLSLEEVRPRIIATLEKEYRDLAVKEYIAGFRMSTEALVDMDALDEIFEPYRPVDPLVSPEPAADAPSGEATQAGESTTPGQ